MNGEWVIFFSLEMSTLSLARRLFAIHSEISGNKVRDADLDEIEEKVFYQFIDYLKTINFYIVDKSGANIAYIKEVCRQFKKKYDKHIRLPNTAPKDEKGKRVYIDYLSLLQGINSYQKKTEVVAQASPELKQLAKELDCPMFVLSQLNRAVETRGGDKRPQLSDLRESGAVEQDADIVIFLYRDEYYGITEDNEGHSTKGVAEVIFKKHRNGALDIVKTFFYKEFTKFKNLDELPSGYGDDTNQQFDDFNKSIQDPMDEWTKQLEDFEKRNLH